jgi:hypothetical protein
MNQEDFYMCGVPPLESVDLRYLVMDAGGPVMEMS